MAKRRTSLAWKHRRHWEIPLLLFLSAGLLVLGLSMPVLQTTALLFWKDEYTIQAGIVNLWEDRHFGLALILLFFSVVFPAMKLLALSALWVLPIAGGSRKRLLHQIKILSKWSMLDVFVVAIIVVITQAGGIIDVKPRAGVYVFAASIVLSMIVTLLIDRRAKG
jgi:paraquat-inducible protein A